MVLHLNGGLWTFRLICILAGYRWATHFGKVVFAFGWLTQIDVLLRCFFDRGFSFERHVHFLALIIARIGFVSVTSLEWLGVSLSWAYSLSRVMIAVCDRWTKIYLSVIVLRLTCVPSIRRGSEGWVLKLMGMMMLHVVACRGRRYVMTRRCSLLKVVH